jgi:hypothetical protein
LAIEDIYFLKKDLVMGSGRKYPIGTRIRLLLGDTATATADDTAAVGGTTAKAGFEQVAILDANTNAVVGEDTIANWDKAYLRRIGEYVLRVHNTGLTRNCSVYLSEMPTKQNRDCYRFGAEDVKAGEGVTVRKERVRFDSFRLPYCATGHSTQGCDIDGRYCIHDIGAAHMSPKWFWTALTRGRNLKNIYVSIGEEQDEPMLEQRSLEVATKKLRLYVESDKRTGREESGYDVSKMASMARDAHSRRCQGLCGESCETVMNLFSDEGDAVSFDRIDNSSGHAVQNLRCVCVACNVWGQDRDGRQDCDE